VSSAAKARTTLPTAQDYFIYVYKLTTDEIYDNLYREIGIQKHAIWRATFLVSDWIYGI
jgi:hypothetical protein